MDKKELEEGTEFQPKFGSDGLIPCITQDANSGNVLMFAFMNKDALAKTLEIGEMVYWSRSRQEIWHKGATSGDIQKVEELRTDCDQDVILAKVKIISDSANACHTGRKTCFYRKVIMNEEALEFID